MNQLKYLLGIQCPSLYDIPNGGITYDNSLFETQAYYYCTEEYQLIGPAQRECQADGSWSGQEPFCICK